MLLIIMNLEQRWLVGVSKGFGEVGGRKGSGGGYRVELSCPHASI